MKQLITTHHYYGTRNLDQSLAHNHSIVLHIYISIDVFAFRCTLDYKHFEHSNIVFCILKLITFKQVCIYFCLVRALIA